MRRCADNHFASSKFNGGLGADTPMQLCRGGTTAKPGIQVVRCSVRESNIALNVNIFRQYSELGVFL